MDAQEAEDALGDALGHRDVVEALSDETGDQRQLAGLVPLLRELDLDLGILVDHGGLIGQHGEESQVLVGEAAARLVGEDEAPHHRAAHADRGGRERADPSILDEPAGRRVELTRGFRQDIERGARRIGRGEETAPCDIRVDRCAGRLARSVRPRGCHATDGSPVEPVDTHVVPPENRSAKPAIFSAIWMKSRLPACSVPSGRRGGFRHDFRVLHRHFKVRRYSWPAPAGPRSPAVR